MDNQIDCQEVDILLVKRALTAALNWLPTDDQDMGALQKARALVCQALDHIKNQQ